MEKADLDIVLASAQPKERLAIIESCKPKNGIERQGRKIGALKERYQIFIVSVFEALGMKSNYYDFKESKRLQNELSSFIHSYYIFNEKITVDSEELSYIPSLISEVEKFVRKSFYVEGEGHTIKSLELKSMPEDDKELLNIWKNDRKMTKEELVERLSENAKKRKTSPNKS